MKILVLSLLRLGDIIQQIPLLRGLRAKYPEAEIHILLNSQFANVADLLDDVVDRCIYFDRNSLQRELGEVGINLLAPYHRLQSLILDLNQERYDLAMNWTHNRLSAHLLGSLEIEVKQGLQHTEGSFCGLSNPWLVYLNDRFSEQQSSLFHYTEILAGAFGLTVQPTQPNEIHDNIKHFHPKPMKRVLFQCLTSDKKKNWALEKYVELKSIIETSLPDHRVFILGAEFERQILEKHFKSQDLVICSLVEARDLLKASDLLITGDTSIKHLAAQVGIPLIEIALGSSDPTKTGAFSSQALVLSSGVACAPCAHSQACSQSTHLCGAEISVQNVFAAVWDQLARQRGSKALGHHLSDKNMNRELDRIVWRVYLNQSEVSGSMGDGSVTKNYLLGSSESGAHFQKWQSQTAVFNTWLSQARHCLPTREEFLRKTSLQATDVTGLILLVQEILKSKSDESGYFTNLVEALSYRFQQPVDFYDRCFAAITITEKLLNIREDLAAHLLTLPKEGAFYAKGIGHIPGASFTEAGSRSRQDLEDAGI